MEMKAWLSILLILATPLAAQTAKVGIAIIPGESEKLTDMIPVAVSSVLNAAEIKHKIQLYPFSRSLREVVTGKVNLHIPIIESPYVNYNEMAYDLSDTILWRVPFVIYSRADKPAPDLNNLGNYKLATELAHQALFNFPTLGIPKVKGAIQMVQMGRIDGFIYAAEAVDPIIIELKLNNIRRTLLGNFNVRGAFAKGSAGGDLDKAMARGLKIFKAKNAGLSGKSVWGQNYTNWQPYEKFAP